jgi:hypothetical protein
MLQGSVLTPILYSLYINDSPRGNWNSSCSVRGRHLYLRDRETRMSRSLQTATRPHCSEFVVWALKHKDQWRKIQAFYFSRRLRVLEEVLQPNGRDISFVNNVTYLGASFDRRMTWKHHIERTVAKALTTYVRTYSLFKSWRLRANLVLTLYKAPLRSVVTYASPTWEYAVDAHLLKFQRLKNGVLRATKDRHRCTQVREMQVAFKIPYVYDYITKLCRTQAEVILNHVNSNVRGIGQREARQRR